VPDHIKSTVDFLEPEFLHSLGIAVAIFAHLEAVLTNVFFAAKHQSQDYASFPDSAMEIYEAHFSPKIDKVFEQISLKVKDPKSQTITELKCEFHKARQARNFIVHGVWRQGNQKGFYRCLMIDRAGRKVLNQVDRNVILDEVTRAEHLMIRLKSLLIAEGLYLAVGPKISLE
jgi:hypothetical protein